MKWRLYFSNLLPHSDIFHSGMHSHYSLLCLHGIISSIKALWFTVKLRATEWHLAVCHAKRTNYPTLDCLPELFSWHSCCRYKETTESCVSFIFFSSEQEISVAGQRYKSSFSPNQDKAINGQRKEDSCCCFSICTNKLTFFNFSIWKDDNCSPTGHQTVLNWCLEAEHICASKKSAPRL